MIAAILTTLTLGGCARTPAPQAPLRVMAAASLAEVVPALGARWTARTGRRVEVELAGSSRHARRLMAGARADVFISASPRWLDATIEAGRVDPTTRAVVARNTLVLAWPADAPPLPLDQLHRARRVALAGEAVPAGRYAREALRRADLWKTLAPHIVQAADVRGALAWITRGEADVGVVYRTDAIAAGQAVRHTPLPPALQPDIQYVAGALHDSRLPNDARAFLAFTTSAEAREVWERAGFAASPPGPISKRSPRCGEGGGWDCEANKTTKTFGTPKTYNNADPSLFIKGRGRGASVRDASRGWGEAPQVDTSAAVRLSLWVALWCVLLGLGPAVGLGYVLARWEFRGKALLSAAALVPLVVPPVVTGLGALSVVGRRGVLGAWLERLGVELTMSEVGAVLAALIVGFPLYMLSARGAFEAVDPRLEALSRSMGHSAWQTFRRVTLPLAAPGIAAGAVLAFGRALGEFGATIVLAGNTEGQTRTIALAIYTALESPGQEPTADRLALASVALALLSVIGYEALQRWQRRRLFDGR